MCVLRVYTTILPVLRSRSRHFRVEPEPIFFLAGAAFFKAALAASFWQAKKESLVVINMT